MNQSELQTAFLEDVRDALQRDGELRPEMRLDDIEEWDSLAMMAVAALLDEHFGVSLTMNDFKKMKTVSDILLKAKI